MIENKQLTSEDLREVSSKRFIAANAAGDPAQLITQPNIHALPMGALTYLTPRAVDILVQPMTFDEFIGASRNIKQGVFGQDTITIRFNEHTGVPQPYVEGNINSPGYNLANVNYSGISVGVAYRELGWNADFKELAGGDLQNFDVIADKTAAVLNALALDRNNINFMGLDDTRGGLPVYGILNFPGLNDYVTVPTGAAGSTKWEDKTSEEIYNDIVFMINTLGRQTDGLSFLGFNRRNEYRIGVSMQVYGYLSKTNSYGLLVLDKIREAFDGRVRIIGIPQMDGYADGDNMAMILVDYGDGTPTAYSSYIELARFFPITQVGHAMSQVIVSALTGCIVNRPMMVARFKGL